MVLNQGKIQEQGTFRELLAHQGPFTDFVAAFLMTVDPESEEDAACKSEV